MHIKQALQHYNTRYQDGKFMCDCEHSRHNRHDPDNPCRHILYLLLQRKGTSFRRELQSIRDTSLLSYIELINNPTKLSNRRKDVLLALYRLGDQGYTDMEIADKLGHEDHNRVRPRRNELADPLEYYRPLVEQVGQRCCSKTERQAKTWRLSQYGKKIVMELKNDSYTKSLLQNMQEKTLLPGKPYRSSTPLRTPDTRGGVLSGK